MQDEFRASSTSLRSKLSVVTNNYDTLRVVRAELSHENKYLTLMLGNVQKEADALRDEKNSLKWTRNELVAKKKALEVEN
jgi:hypothetical protein